MVVVAAALVVRMAAADTCVSEAGYTRVGDLKAGNPRQAILQGSKGKCVFPFTYKGNTYNSCLKTGDTTKAGWCSWDAGYIPDSGRWGYCTTEGDECPQGNAETASCSAQQLESVLHPGSSALTCTFPFTDGNGVKHYSCADVDEYEGKLLGWQRQSLPMISYHPLHITSSIRLLGLLSMMLCSNESMTTYATHAIDVLMYVFIQDWVGVPMTGLHSQIAGDSAQHRVRKVCSGCVTRLNPPTR